MGDVIDFGELSHDEELKSRILGFEENFKKVEELIETFCSLNVYEELPPEDKVRYELFHAFAINSLYWFYLRIKGIDPNQHDIKSELSRIKDFMVKSKKIYEKQTLMPRVDQDAAKRFIRSGLWDPNQNNSENEVSQEETVRFRKRKRE